MQGVQPIAVDKRKLLSTTTKAEDASQTVRHYMEVSLMMQRSHTLQPHSPSLIRSYLNGVRVVVEVSNKMSSDAVSMWTVVNGASINDACGIE